MNAEPKMKDCVVLLEPMTPKSQLTLSSELRNAINERNILTSRSKKKFLTALDELNATDTESRRRRKKNQAVQEILDSEAVYLKQLETVMEYFMRPIKEKSVLTDFQYEVLFGSVGSIYKVNGELLNELKADLTNVASAFSKLAPFFKLYSVYAYDFKKSLETLEKLHEGNAEFCKLLDNQESRPEVQAKLSSLLITPIQRIPRYCLLLRQVFDNTLTSEPEYYTLKESLEKLEEVARHVNNLVEERENSQRLLELQRCIKNGKSLVVQPSRRLIKEGVLVKYDGKTKENIYVILFNTILMFCKIRKTKLSNPRSMKCSTIFPLNRCALSQNANTKMFEVACQGETLTLYHEKGSVTDEWIKAIDAAIAKSVRNRMTLRKGSSSRRPAGKNNLEQYMDVGVSPGVSRLRKRRMTAYEKRELEVSGEKSSQEKLPKLERLMKRTKIFPSRLSRRRSIHAEATDEETAEIASPRQKDMLYPLRQHFLENGGRNDAAGTIQPYRPNVFVFGRESNQNRGFTFRLGNLFSGIGSSVKRAFERLF